MARKKIPYDRTAPTGREESAPVGQPDTGLDALFPSQQGAAPTDLAALSPGGQAAGGGDLSALLGGAGGAGGLGALGGAQGGGLEGLGAGAEPDDAELQEMIAMLDDPSTPPEIRAQLEQMIAMAARRQLAGMGGQAQGAAI